MSTVKILIADDEPIIRLDLRQVLETLGYEVIGEAN
jgi:response regulator NasT